METRHPCKSPSRGTIGGVEPSRWQCRSCKHERGRSVGGRVAADALELATHLAARHSAPQPSPTTRGHRGANGAPRGERRRDGVGQRRRRTAQSHEAAAECPQRAHPRRRRDRRADCRADREQGDGLRRLDRPRPHSRVVAERGPGGGARLRPRVRRRRALPRAGARLRCRCRLHLRTRLRAARLVLFGALQRRLRFHRHALHERRRHDRAARAAGAARLDAAAAASTGRWSDSRSRRFGRRVPPPRLLPLAAAQLGARVHRRQVRPYMAGRRSGSRRNWSSPSSCSTFCWGTVRRTRRRRRRRSAEHFLFPHACCRLGLARSL